MIIPIEPRRYAAKSFVLRLFGKLFRVDQQEAALAGAELFAMIKTKCRKVAEQSRVLSFACGKKRVRAIFHHRQVMLASDLENRLDVTDIAEVMGANYCFSARRNPGANRRWIDIKSIRVDVGKDRH